jgi:hypothetical protein
LTDENKAPAGTTRGPQPTQIIVGAVLVVGGAIGLVRVLQSSPSSNTQSRPIVADTSASSVDPPASATAALGFERNTRTSADMTRVTQIDESDAVKRSYGSHGFTSRHAVVYAHKGFTYDPATWTKGVTGSASVVYDKFRTAGDAVRAAADSAADLRAAKMRPVNAAAVPGAQAVQRESQGLLSTIIVVPAGTMVVKVAGACAGCRAGSVPADLAALTKAIAEAVKA